MKKRQQICAEEARQIGKSLQFDWDQIDLEQFRQGLMENLKPITSGSGTGSSFDGVLLTEKIVLAHMQEFPDYFDRLAKLEAEVEEYKARRR